MTEATFTLNAEITSVKHIEDDSWMPDWSAVEKRLKERLNADDVHITNGKMFISKEDAE